jgi:hypothetical protein
MIIRTQDDKNKALNRISLLVLDKPWEIDIKPYKKNRSFAQNKLYRRWLGEISEFNGDDPDALHEHFKEQYIETEYVTAFGKTKAKTKTTTDLNTKEFTQYLEKIDRFCVSFLNLVLSSPEDLIYEALGYRR